MNLNRFRFFVVVVSSAEASGPHFTELCYEFPDNRCLHCNKKELIQSAKNKCLVLPANSCVSSSTQRNASSQHLDMPRILFAAFSITASALQMKVQHTAKLRALSKAHAVSCAEADALRAQVNPNAVPCAEAAALMAKAKHLRTQVEIDERQLNKLRADAAPQVEVGGKNNILPLERLKTWRTRMVFEGNQVMSAAWTKFQEGGKAELDCCEVDGDGCAAGWSLSETARTAPTGAKLLECWFKKGGKTYKLKTRAFPRAEVEKLLRIEQDAFDLIERLRTKLTKAEAALADAKELTKFALAALDARDADMAAERLQQALSALGR